MRRFALALSVVLIACTFPDVDYADDSGGGACPAPPGCESDASSCALQAADEHSSCSMKCKPQKPECPGKCDQERDTALTSCAVACVSCAASDCGSKPTNCSTLVGL